MGACPVALKKTKREGGHSTFWHWVELHAGLEGCASHPGLNTGRCGMLTLQQEHFVFALGNQTGDPKEVAQPGTRARCFDGCALHSRRCMKHQSDINQADKQAGYSLLSGKQFMVWKQYKCFRGLVPLHGKDGNIRAKRSES